MIVYPAIDIRAGQCVRLVEGDFARETVYDVDPARAARVWLDAGAEWLHIVDLDGAAVGEPVNHDAIRRIRGETETPIQVGGGFRLIEHIAAAIDLGVDRVILGTVAVRQPELVATAVARWGNQIAVALDARDGRLATEGWLHQSDALATDVAVQLQAIGIQRFISTDISRDGTLAGPNLTALSRLIADVEAEVIASGGVASAEDVAAVAATGAGGVIVGRALYDGRVDLPDAIAAARGLGSLQ
ncbi:MAG: 1-(5-phosphoribosyl)-5-[(5-phosphoribosylamino)methylideneamino]imidazole-4-carboxamide isomerase [Chloroflexota bacterium]|nr:1-(5-phosphoribosyl)-5-[(5-phosphoribosylamino)methylideneamino]imidazole-4-carboxamide isomerase [Chloroflexota bacterium]